MRDNSSNTMQTLITPLGGSKLRFTMSWTATPADFTRRQPPNIFSGAYDALA